MKNARNVAMVSLSVLLVVIIALLLYFLISGGEFPTSSAVTSNSPSSLEKSAHDELQPDKSVDIYKVLSEIVEGESPQDAWVRFSTDPDFFSDENLRQIIDIAEAWIEQEGVSILDTISADIHDEELKESIVRTSLNTLSESDPVAAFEYALQFETESVGLFGMMSENPYLNSILRRWATDRPLEALNHLTTIDSKTQQNKYADQVFQSWARHNLESLVESIPQIPIEWQDAARVNGIYQLSYDSIDESRALFAEIKDDEKKRRAALRIVSTWGESDPEAALRWAQNDPNTESIRSEVTGVLLTTLAQNKPQRAFDIALEIPIGKDGVGLEAMVISSMAYSNIDKALENLPNVRQGETQRSAYMGVGSGLAMQGRIDAAFDLGNNLDEEDQLTYCTTVGTMALSGSMVSNMMGSDTKSEVDVVASIEKIPLETARSKVAMQAIVMDKLKGSYSDEEIKSLKDHLSDEDLDELEKSLKQLDAMPKIPGFGF